MRSKGFPGTDSRTNDSFMSDVVADEKAIMETIRSVREHEAVSLEEISFLLGVGAGQISRYLNGTCATTLTNYLRIVRALGYRCRVVLEKPADDVSSRAMPDLKISSHKVRHSWPTPSD